MTCGNSPRERILRGLPTTKIHDWPDIKLDLSQLTTEKRRTMCRTHSVNTTDTTKGNHDQCLFSERTTKSHLANMSPVLDDTLKTRHAPTPLRTPIQQTPWPDSGAYSMSHVLSPKRSGSVLHFPSRHRVRAAMCAILKHQPANWSQQTFVILECSFVRRQSPHQVTPAITGKHTKCQSTSPLRT